MPIYSCCATMAEEGNYGRDRLVHKPEIFTIWPFKIKFTNPSSTEDRILLV